MKTEDFEVLLQSRVEQIQSVLGNKAKEYAQDDDRLYNFKIAARTKGETPEKALWGMAVKHLVSVMDLVDGKLESTPPMVDEKVGDMINYLILLEAILKEDKAA